MSALLRMVAWILAVALVAAPVVALVNGWIGADRWPLRTLRVHGQFERVDEASLRTTVLPFARQGFFAVDLDAARGAVSRLPWVERAEVSKRWPDVLEVRVVEHAPFALWGGDRVLSVRGLLFPAEGVDLPAGLPRFDGPEARVSEIVALYNESRAMFAPGGRRIASVGLDPRGSWTLRLSDGTEVMVGRSDARPRLARFARVLPGLVAREPRPLVRADLRYTNGFALVWGEADADATATGTPPGAAGAPRDTNRAAQTAARRAGGPAPTRGHA